MKFLLLVRLFYLFVYLFFAFIENRFFVIQDNLIMVYPPLLFPATAYLYSNLDSYFFSGSLASSHM